MARLLEQIDWGKPVLPLGTDPTWATEVEQAFGEMRPCYMYAESVPWLRQGLLYIAKVEYNHAAPDLIWLVTLVTSQENACRYCYGAALSYLRLLGVSEKRIAGVEQELRVAGDDPLERAVLQFSRNLSRSHPRPAYAEVEALKQLGLAPIVTVELALAIVAACFANRYATFAAVPLFEEAETTEDRGISGWVRPMLAKLFKSPPRPLPPLPAPAHEGPFGRLVALLDGTDGEAVIGEMLRGAFASNVLPRRTKGWMFAVIAEALECKLSMEGARNVLGSEGIEDSRIDAVINALAGPELDETEALLLPWVRETAHYQTEAIQRRTRELATKLDPTVLLEVIGVASLANACARLSLLEQ